MSKTFKSVTDLDPTFKEISTPSITKMVNPELSDIVDVAFFSKDVKEYVKRRNALYGHINRFYLVVWGQCSKLMRET